jgi:hypothetical protein
MVGVKRSRVHFQGHAIERRRQDKVQPEQQKHAKSTLNGHELAPGGKATATTVPRLHDLDNKGKATDDRPDTGATEHEDAPKVDMPLFSKKRVESLEEIAHSGHLQSRLHAENKKMVNSHTANESADEIDYPDSPPASLLMEASAYMKRNAGIQQQCQREPETERFRPKAARKNSSSQPSSSSPLFKSIANLFGGRKRSNKKKEALKRSNSDLYECPTTHPHEGISWARAEPEHPPTPPTSPLEPKLTHTQVIPAVWRPTRYDPWRRYGYKEILGAPAHWSQGTGVRDPDVFTPETVQRGFNVPNAAPSTSIQRGFEVPTTTRPAAPRVPRREPSASRLLDRNSDPWARWYDSEEGGGGARK